MTGGINVRRVIRHALIGQGITVIIDPCPHSAGAQGDILHLAKGRQCCGDPFIRRFTAQFDPIDRRAATPMGGLFNQKHPPALLACVQRSLKPCNPTANDQKINMGVEMLVTICIAIFGGFAQTRRLADDGFKHMLPKRARVDECLVIKARRQEPRKVIVHHADIVFKARPVVLALRLKSFEQFGGGHALVRLKPRITAQTDKRVWFFRARGHNAARAVIFERAAHQHLIFRQKRRGQRIARKPTHFLAVKFKRNRAGLVDQTAALRQTMAHVRLQSGRFACIFAIISLGGSGVCAL